MAFYYPEPSHTFTVVVLVVLRILHNRRTSFLKSGTGLLYSPKFDKGAYPLWPSTTRSPPTPSASTCWYPAILIHGAGGIFGRFRKIIEVSVNWKGVRLWN